MKKSPLAKKLTLFVIALSSVITILTTGLQLFFDYTKELKDIQSKIETIQTIQLRSLGHSMWTFDAEGIRIIIDNILRIGDIEYIEVVIDERHWWQGGKLKSKNIVDRIIPVYFFNGYQDVDIGKLRIVASIDNVFGRLIDKAIIILVSNGFKTFFVSLFILFLFNRLVTRHLTDLSVYADEVASGDLKSPFTLQRNKKSGSVPDELDRAVSAINAMRENLLEEVEKLRNTEKRLTQTRLSVDAVSDSVFWLTSDGRIVDVNNTACVSLGYSRDELLALNIGDVDPDYDKDIWIQHFQELRDTRSLRFESRHRRQDGSMYPVEIVANYILYDDIELNCAIARNIEENKKAEAEKQKLSEQLQQAQKMEAIGTLAGGIAHDFNNILSAINGYAEMARDDSTPGSTVAKYLEKVIEGGVRAKDLVQQILAFSRQSKMEKIYLHPAPIVKEAIKMLRSSLPATIEINQDISSATGLILANPSQIHQILMNLCTNAFHAMEETGGKLGVSLNQVTLSSEDLVHESNVEAGVFIQLSISDSGSGIAPDIKKNIFDPYFTTKETGKGTGMGLAIVHGIVKSCDGFISCCSELGEGTVFNVYFPVIKKELQTEVEDSKPIPIGMERIFFIDDEEVLVEMGKSMLERLGYHVTVSKNSIEALEIFKRQSDQFDLVITDQTMPGMTGSDIAKKMLQIRPDIPIILLTGYSSIISEERAKSIGIKEFALKPFSKKDISVLIRKVLDDL